MSFINETLHHAWDTSFWGPVTATLDWCEANYQFSRYIAEVSNTFSNLASVLLALWGAQQARSASLPARYFAGYTGFALVGLGSMIFHATLLYEAQLADELPMIYVASYCASILFDTQRGYTLRSAKAASLTATFFAFNIFFTWSYSVYRNPVYHQTVFAIIMISTALRTTYLLRHSELSTRVPEADKISVARICGAGAGVFALGFVVWNLDNVFCSTITRWKHTVGWPAAFLLEGHSWWHILTAIGTYLLLIGNTYLTLCIKDSHTNFQIEHHFGLPAITRVGKGKMQ